MKIITVTKPAFLWNEVPYVVQSQILKVENPFTQLQEIMDKKEKDGFTHCFIYNLTNAPVETDGDIIGETELRPMFIRWSFAKVEVPTEIKLGKNLKKIEEILRDEQ